MLCCKERLVPVSLFQHDLDVDAHLYLPSYLDDVTYWFMLLSVKEGRVVLMDVVERCSVYVDNIM